MFERYTEQARRALFFARYEVSNRGGEAIGTEHLLLGLLHEPRGVVGRLFEEQGVTAERVLADLGHRPRPVDRVPVSVEIPISPESKAALTQAAREADALRHQSIDAEHLLLALAADGRTAAGALLARYGLSHDVALARLAGWSRVGRAAPSNQERGSGDGPDPGALFATFTETPPPFGAGAVRPLRMYAELARWWPLLSPPSHYVEEAADLIPPLVAACHGPATTLLELGSGGGSLAFHLKDRFRLTLTDLSPQMLEVNRATNPECEHAVGDMRTLDLGRTFDLVLIHDAIMYATDEAQVRATLATAARHLRPGGAVTVLPDCVAETFEPDTDCGGEDAPDGRGLRYLEWSWDPDRHDTTFEVAYGFLLREADGTVRTDLDRHTEGLFPRASWLAWLRDAGFDPSVRTDPWGREVFAARRLEA